MTDQAKSEGLLSTPFVEGDRLYYVTPAAQVVCATTEGKNVWTRDLIKEFEVYPHFVTFSPPLVVGDLVYAVTGNGRAGDDPEEGPAPPQAAELRRHRQEEQQSRLARQLSG